MQVITSKLPELLNSKGCDASNIFDEEVIQTEQDFSDDEKEREFKKQKKENRRMKNAEDGEIIESKKRKNHTKHEFNF